MQAKKGYLHGSVRLSTHVKNKERKQPVWELRYRLPSGKQSDKVLGKAWTKQSRPPEGYLTHAQAQAVAQRFLDEHADTVPDDRKTFGRACQEFLRFCEREKNLAGSTLAEYRRITERLGERLWRGTDTWSERPLDTFTEAELLALREEWLDGGLNPHTINVARGVLRGVFGERKVMQCWKWVGLKRNQSKGKIRFYTPAQVAQLKLCAADDRDRAIFTLATEEGLRMSEVRGLKILNLDFDRRIVRIEDGYTDAGGHAATKSHQVRSMPMTDNTHSLLLAYCVGRPLYDAEGNPTPVFADEGKDAFDYHMFYRRFRTAMRTAGLPQITPHELRHTFGTQMIQHPKIDIYKLQRLMGHADITTTAIYLHFQPDPDLADTMSGIWESDAPADVVPLRRAS